MYIINNIIAETLTTVRIISSGPNDPPTYRPSDSDKDADIKCASTTRFWEIVTMYAYSQSIGKLNN